MNAPQTVWWVYMIHTVDDRLYSGVSTDVARRFREHRAGGGRAAKYLKTHRPSAVVFSLPVGSRSLAQKVEYHMKRLSRGRKDAIIRHQRLVFDPQSGRIAN